MTRSSRLARALWAALPMSMLVLPLGCDDATGPEPSVGAVFEGDWTAPVHGSVMTLRIGEFASLGSEGQILWDVYVGRLSCRYRVSEDPSLQCSIIGLDSPEIDDGACIPDGRRFPYVDILAADSSTIRAVVGGEQHRFATPCVNDPYLRWEPAVEVEFRRQ